MPVEMAVLGQITSISMANHVFASKHFKRILLYVGARHGTEVFLVFEVYDAG